MNELNGKTKGVKEKVELIEAEITKKKEEKGFTRPGLTTKRSFNTLMSYKGAHETYEDWKSKVKTFLYDDKDVKGIFVNIFGGILKCDVLT